MASASVRPPPGPPRVAVLAPSTVVTVTIERGGTTPEIHFHAGGQGFWVARMAGALGADAMLATALGGESGALLRVLLEAEPVAVHAIRAGSDNGVYVHHRRGGARELVARVPAPHLRRHEADELYGVALADALEARVACLTGPEHPDVLDPGLYARIARDLRRNEVTTLADLTGAPLRAALDAGVDVLRLSDIELVSEGWAAGGGPQELAAALGRLHEAGAGVVIASRGPRPAIALVEGELFVIRGPELLAADPSGTGDAMFAAVAAGLAAGREMIDAIVLGVAAGAVNATRHGLGSGTRELIDRLSRYVAVERFVQAPGQDREPA